MSIRVSHAAGRLLQQPVHYLIVCATVCLCELLGASVMLISLGECVCLSMSVCVHLHSCLGIHEQMGAGVYQRFPARAGH